MGSYISLHLHSDIYSFNQRFIFTFLTQHRYFCYNLILCCQADVLGSDIICIQIFLLLVFNNNREQVALLKDQSALLLVRYVSVMCLCHFFGSWHHRPIIHLFFFSFFLSFSFWVYNDVTVKQVPRWKNQRLVLLSPSAIIILVCFYFLSES